MNSNFSAFQRIVLLKLENFWKHEDDQIDMNKLCRGLTVIVAARVFLELLSKFFRQDSSYTIIQCLTSLSVLSKIRKIELIADEHLHIVNIERGDGLEILENEEDSEDANEEEDD